MTGTGETLAVSVSGARKVYDAGIGHARRTAVADVSLTVPEGHIHGLLGPNGAGKTTTLKMLLGLVRPTAGTFEVFGERSVSRAGKSATGFLPEAPYFPVQLTAGQVMRLYARLSGLGRPEAKTRTDELLERVGLEGRIDTRLAAFSRGMLQRLGIAQALLSRPRVVILDEPASGLDPVGQRDVRNLMLELRESGTTVLLSSHRLSEVEAVCDAVTILDRGTVAAEGHIDDLLNVAGETSVRVSGLASGLPETVAPLARDVAAKGGTWLFSVDDADVRRVVDAVDDAGARIIGISPKRESLEDYFARLLARPHASDEGGGSR